MVSRKVLVVSIKYGSSISVQDLSYLLWNLYIIILFEQYHCTEHYSYYRLHYPVFICLYQNSWYPPATCFVVNGTFLSVEYMSISTYLVFNALNYILLRILSLHTSRLAIKFTAPSELISNIMFSLISFI